MPVQAPRKKAIRGPSVRWLLLGVSAVILVLPVAAVLGLKVYQNHLVRQTEASLIAQSVIIGELWRDRWLEASGIARDEAPQVRPPDRVPPRRLRRANCRYGWPGRADCSPGS